MPKMMDRLDRIVKRDPPQFIVNENNVIILDKTGFGVAELTGFYDHLLGTESDGHTFDDLLEGIMFTVNHSLRDYYETKKKCCSCSKPATEAGVIDTPEYP